MWLKDFLPKSFPRARIMTFDHDSAWRFDAPVESVEDYGQKLLDALNTRRKSPEVSSQKLLTCEGCCILTIL